MAKFLIEVPHEAEELPCARVVKKFLESGSHFLVNADWGCSDGVHKVWVLLEANNKDEARYVLPSPFRSQALIVALNKFSEEEIDSVLKKYELNPKSTC